MFQKYFEFNFCILLSRMSQNALALINKLGDKWRTDEISKFYKCIEMI